MRLIALLLALALNACASSTAPADAAAFCQSHAPLVQLCLGTPCDELTAQERDCIARASQSDASCGAIARCVGADAAAE